MTTQYRHFTLLIILFFSVFPLSANTPYITHVYEYHPAPGQFVNIMPQIAGNPEKAAEEQIAGNNQGMVCLGGWGGYIVFGFDHPVVNVAGGYDLLIEGNAYYQTPDDPTKGSSEPGIVCVSQDINKNGIPDDPWYEIQGSEHNNTQTIDNYRITYYRTPADHVAAPADKPLNFFTDTTYIYWQDNQGNEGYMPKNSFHKQDYFPEWITDNELTFTGTLLPPNGVDNAGKGINYTMTCYDYGYADAHPNTSDHAKINLEWAVGEDGMPANLTHVDFVKVYTGVYQICGMIGEVSTEITGAQDLHLDAVLPSSIEQTRLDDMPSPRKVFRNGMIFIRHGNALYTPVGQYYNAIIND